MSADFPEIPGYEIEKLLGTGGFASVYLARQVMLDRPVALKVMDPKLARDRDFCERFVREARDTAGLGTHPHIVTVHDIGRVRDVYYIAMQYLSGPNLEEIVAANDLQQHPLEIVARIADALGYAHARGFVHRDIKPANILFDESNDAVLSDFGIAKSLDRDTLLTAAGSIIGTARYMSPEQARGLDTIDCRSDLYSLGVVLYELLAGEPPYRSRDPMTLMLKHVTDPVPALPEEEAVHQPLIDRLMAKQPEERYGCGAELLEDIARHLDVSGYADEVFEADVPRSRIPLPLAIGGSALASALVGGYFVVSGLSPTGGDTLDAFFPNAATLDVLAEDARARVDVADEEIPRGTDTAVDVPGDVAVADTVASPSVAGGSDDGVATIGAAGTGARVRPGSANDEAPGGGVANLGAYAPGTVVFDAGTPVAGPLYIDVVDTAARDAAGLVGAGPAPGHGSSATDVAAIDGPAMSDAELQRLERLLDVAELHELVGRISEPPGSNAIEAYALALEIDPGNSLARNALARLGSD